MTGRKEAVFDNTLGTKVHHPSSSSTDEGAWFTKKGASSDSTLSSKEVVPHPSSSITCEGLLRQAQDCIFQKWASTSENLSENTKKKLTKSFSRLPRMAENEKPQNCHLLNATFPTTVLMFNMFPNKSIPNTSSGQTNMENAPITILLLRYSYEKVSSYKGFCNTNCNCWSKTLCHLNHLREAFAFLFSQRSFATNNNQQRQTTCYTLAKCFTIDQATLHEK